MARYGLLTPHRVLVVMRWTRLGILQAQRRRSRANDRWSSNAKSMSGSEWPNMFPALDAVKKMQAAYTLPNMFPALDAVKKMQAAYTFPAFHASKAMRPRFVSPELNMAIKGLQASLAVPALDAANMLQGLQSTLSKLEVSLASPELIATLSKMQASYALLEAKDFRTSLVRPEVARAIAELQEPMFTPAEREDDGRDLPRGLKMSEIEFFMFVTVFLWALAAKLNDFSAAGVAVTQFDPSQVMFAAVEICGVPLLAIAILRLLVSWLRRESPHLPRPLIAARPRSARCGSRVELARSLATPEALLTRAVVTGQSSGGGTGLTEGQSPARRIVPGWSRVLRR